MARDIAVLPPVRPAKAAVGYPTPSTENASNGLQFSALVLSTNVISGSTKIVPSTLIPAIYTLLPEALLKAILLIVPDPEAICLKL